MNKLSLQGFGQRIRSVRVGLGIQQNDLADRLGMYNGYLSEIENGYKIPSMKRAVLIANALGVGMDYLLGEVE